MAVKTWFLYGIQYTSTIRELFNNYLSYDSVINGLDAGNRFLPTVSCLFEEVPIYPEDIRILSAPNVDDSV